MKKIIKNKIPIKNLSLYIKKLIKNNYNINIQITNKQYIKIINKKYRKINKSTDILTFEYENRTLGDIILCPKLINKNFLEKTIIHGILHLLKYNHENITDRKIMNKIEIKIGMSGIEPPTITTSK